MIDKTLLTMDGFTKEQVKTFMWLAYQAGKTAGRIEGAAALDEISSTPKLYFKNWYESFEPKVRPDYSIFEDFPNGGITLPWTNEDGSESVTPVK